MKRLLLGLLFVLAVLALLAGGYVVARNFMPSAPNGMTYALGWRNPLRAVDGSAVAPDLALRSLAGEPTHISAEQALLVEELATAYAGVVFGVDIDDTRRAGLLLALTDRYLKKEDEEGASLCLRQIRDLAALSPTLADPLRAEVSLQMGVYWREVGAPGEARRSFDQAYGIALGSRVMQPVQRRQLFLRLVEEYRALGDRQRTEEAKRMANLARGPEPDAATMGLVLDGLYGEMALPEEVTSLVMERQARARRIVEMLSQDLRADVTPEAADLGEFLRREDAARQVWYAEARTHPDLASRASAAREQVYWLAVKLRVAARGYGLTLVPEWESDIATIRSSLSAAITEWARIMEAQLLSLPDPRAVRRGELELLRQQVLWGRLGLYPDYPAEALVQGMLEAVETLRLHGQLGGLLLQVVGEGDEQAFMLLENP